VVTGAGSGIGNAFARILIDEVRSFKQLSHVEVQAKQDEQGYEVHAADFTPSAALQELQCRLHVLDVRKQDSIFAFAEQLSNKPIDVLLNVAGVMSPQDDDRFETVSPEVLTKTFETNTFGPLLLTQALLSNLLLSDNPRVGIVSSRVGSIEDNNTGGSYAYRASKAAVNSVGKSMSVDLKQRGIVVSLLHPGITRTNISASVTQHPESVEPEEAAGKLWRIMSGVGMEDTGKFWHREGYELPW